MNGVIQVPFLDPDLNLFFLHYLLPLPPFLLTSCPLSSPTFLWKVLFSSRHNAAHLKILHGVLTLSCFSSLSTHSNQFNFASIKLPPILCTLCSPNFLPSSLSSLSSFLPSPFLPFLFLTPFLPPIHTSINPSILPSTLPSLTSYILSTTLPHAPPYTTSTSFCLPWGQFCNRVYLFGNNPPMEGNPSRRNKSKPNGKRW